MTIKEKAKKMRLKTLGLIAGVTVTVAGAGYGINESFKKDAQKDKIENTISQKDQQKLNEEFYDALRLTDVDRVKNLIEKGADVNAKYDGENAIMLLARSHTFPERHASAGERKRDNIMYRNIYYFEGGVVSGKDATLAHKKNEAIIEIIHILVDNGFDLIRIGKGSVDNLKHTLSKLKERCYRYEQHGLLENYLPAEELKRNIELAKSDEEAFGSLIKFLVKQRDLQRESAQTESAQTENQNRTYHIANSGMER